MSSDQLQMLTMGDYWQILRQRKMLFFGTFAAALALGVALAFLLPPTYKSEATIKIERQSIPQDLVATTVTGYVQEQIEQIWNQLSAHETLLEIARDYDLYPGERDTDPSGVARRMADNIDVQMDEVMATDPNRSGERRATIAFTVSFLHSDPKIAQAVTAELAQRYLQVHKSDREEQAEEVSQFLQGEADKLKAEIAELESVMASFKQEELRRLPELMDMNLRLFEKTESEIAETEVRLRNERDKIEALQSELSLTPAYEDVETESGERLLSAEKQLSSLTAQYLRASARYSAKHPDVIKLAREIRILAEQTGQGARADELLNELALMQERLRDLRRSYSDDHPDVRSAEQSISAIQRGIQTAILGANSNAAVRLAPDNPRYVSLQTQINAARSNLRGEQSKLATLKNKLTEYEERLFNTPGVERDFRALSLDYNNATAKYAEIKDKQLQARLAQQLESGSSAEKFTLLSAAYLPTLPDSPNRIGLILLSGLLGFACGLGAVAVAEYLDHTIRGARSLELALGFPPLATIPNGARSSMDLRKFRRMSS